MGVIWSDRTNSPLRGVSSKVWNTEPKVVIWKGAQRRGHAGQIRLEPEKEVGLVLIGGWLIEGNSHGKTYEVVCEKGIAITGGGHVNGAAVTLVNANT